MALLESLAEDIRAQEDRVEDEEQHFEPDENVRRAARYFMYRKWVSVKFDNIPLGKGNRVRIPPCVVECIRDHFREPAGPGCASPVPGALCACARGGPLFSLFACKQYTGHREAPAEDSD